MMISNKQNIPALTGYRAIAAWLVFVYHFFPFNNPNYPTWGKYFISSFHIGVDLFFVLSGFLITYRYYNQKSFSLKKYFINRVARIYPMYFFLTIGVFVVFYAQNHIWPIEKTKEFILSITLTKALFKDYFSVGISQGWTLTLEELFYLTAPLYFWIIKKNYRYIIALPIILFLTYGFSKSLLSSIDFSGFLQTNIHVYIFEFFGGIALAYGVLSNKIKKDIKGTTYWAVFFLIFYCATRYAYFSKIIDLKSELNRAIEIILLTLLGILPLIYGLIFEKTIFQKILSTRLFIILGQSSYIFYLIHKGFIPIFIDKYFTSNILLLFILLNSLSYLLFKYIEEPLNIRIKKSFTSVDK